MWGEEAWKGLANCLHGVNFTWVISVGHSTACWGLRLLLSISCQKAIKIITPCLQLQENRPQQLNKHKTTATPPNSPGKTTTLNEYRKHCDVDRNCTAKYPVILEFLSVNVNLIANNMHKWKREEKQGRRGIILFQYFTKNFIINWYFIGIK